METVRVKFQAAVILKALGYTESKPSSFHTRYYHTSSEEKLYAYGRRGTMKDEDLFLAPTVFEVQEWIMQKYNTFISAHPISTNMWRVSTYLTYATTSVMEDPYIIDKSNQLTLRRGLESFLIKVENGKE